MLLSTETGNAREKFGDFKGIELIKKAGFDAVDYSFTFLRLPSPAMEDNYIDYAKSLRECLEQNEIVCNQAHAPMCMEYGLRFDLDEYYYRRTVRSIESAAIMGAPHIIVHTLAIPKEVTDVDFTEYNLRFFKSLEPYCEKFGIRIGIENFYDYFSFTRENDRRYYVGSLHTAELLGGFVEQLDSPWFTACLDVGHAAITGEKPEEIIQKMSPDILGALHIQDTDYHGDRHFLPFCGNLDWTAIMKSLGKIGYRGDLTFEACRFFSELPNELFFDGLKYAHQVGRYLISLMKEN